MLKTLSLLSVLSFSALAVQPNYLCKATSDSEHGTFHRSVSSLKVERLPGGRYRADDIVLFPKGTNLWRSRNYASIEYIGIELEVARTNPNRAFLTVGDDRYQIWTYFDCTAVR